MDINKSSAVNNLLFICVAQVAFLLMLLLVYKIWDFWADLLC